MPLRVVGGGLIFLQQKRICQAAWNWHRQRKLFNLKASVMKFSGTKDHVLLGVDYLSCSEIYLISIFKNTWKVPFIFPQADLFAFPLIFCVKRETFFWCGKTNRLLWWEMAEQEINYFPPGKHQNSPKLSRTGWTCGDNEIGVGSWEIVIKKAKSVKACAAALRAILRNAILGRWSRHYTALCW